MEEVELTSRHQVNRHLADNDFYFRTVLVYTVDIKRHFAATLGWYSITKVPPSILVPECYITEIHSPWLGEGEGVSVITFGWLGEGGGGMCN